MKTTWCEATGRDSQLASCKLYAESGSCRGCGMIRAYHSLAADCPLRQRMDVTIAEIAAEEMDPAEEEEVEA